MAMRIFESLKRTTRGAGGHGDPGPLRYVRESKLLFGGNHALLLRRGEEAYPAMLEAIANARRSVHLETYILRSDATGRLFQAALIERARRGVDVRLMFDSVGSLGLISNEYLGALSAAGVDIVEYHPITPWRRRLLERLHVLRASTASRLGRPAAPRRLVREPAHWGFNRRNHHKILVVDEEVAFTGGLNIGDEYAPLPDGANWHDLAVRVEGPVARGLARIFHRSWIEAGGELFPQPVASLPDASRRPMLAHTCDNLGLVNRSRMHGAYRHAIRHATSSVSIMNAYFIPDRWLRRALAAAAKRGVSVRVIVPASSDVKLVGHASRRLFGRLLRAGVRIFEYEGEMMHAKAAVIDRHWTTIGSYNLDKRSMFHNLEAGVVVLDSDFGGSLEREFEASLQHCREVLLPLWNRRPLAQRLLERFAHLFAYWL
jgi:cardiolipin synthase